MRKGEVRGVSPVYGEDLDPTLSPTCFCILAMASSCAWVGIFFQVSRQPGPIHRHGSRSRSAPSTHPDPVQQARRQPGPLGGDLPRHAHASPRHELAAVLGLSEGRGGEGAWGSKGEVLDELPHRRPSSSPLPRTHTCHRSWTSFHTAARCSGGRLDTSDSYRRTSLLSTWRYTYHRPWVLGSHLGGPR